MTTPSPHPDKLLWYLSGNLEPEESRHVESHLLICADCRAIAHKLKPLKTARSTRQALTRHPEPEELDAYRLAAPDVRSIEQAPIETHLRQCADCREDLAALEQMAEALPGARPRIRGWLVAAAAGLALLVAAPLTWVWLAGHQPAVRLMPSLRSAAATSVLSGHGPWRANLVPPSEAGTGVYEINVERPDGSLVASLDSRGLAAGQEMMQIEIPALPGPGPYQISIRLAGQDGASPHVYSFRVASDSGD